MEKEELKKILKLHAKWLNDEPGGKRANLSVTDLIYANLSWADLSETDLRYVDLSGTNLINTKLNEAENYRKGQILKNKIIGFKKCKDNVVVTLEIPKNAIVFGINGKYFRTNIAKCINISNDSKIAFSFFNNNFTYEVGKTYEIKDFDLMYNVEAGKGIHFFKTLEEAKNSY